MRLTDGSTPRKDNGTSTTGTAVWRFIAMPALPPSRRERASRAAAFATRVLAPQVLLPATNRWRG